VDALDRDILEHERADTFLDKCDLSRSLGFHRSVGHQSQHAVMDTIAHKPSGMIHDTIALLSDVERRLEAIHRINFGDDPHWLQVGYTDRANTLRPGSDSIRRGK